MISKDTLFFLYTRASKITIFRYFFFLHFLRNVFLLCNRQIKNEKGNEKTGVFYGSTTGTTEAVATQIAEKLGIASADVYDVSKMIADMVGAYEALILGTLTWGDGELQDDWYDGIKVLKGMDLKDKVITLFGCGDSESYGDTFCDGMGVLYEDLKDSGCHFVGAVSDSDYAYSSSISVVDGNFVGLAIDDVNESDKIESHY